MKTIQNLEYPRYGHWSVYWNGYVFVIGGFSMDDNIDVEPSTLSSWEKYHYKENMWTPAAPLNIPRAYSGVVAFKSQSKKGKLSFVKGIKKINETLFPSYEYIYLFAGLNDFVVLDSIEKYDAVLDLWTLLHIKMPMKIAKIGVSILEPNLSILICGGIHNNQDDEFVYINHVFKLDMIMEKWTQMPSMHQNRVLYPTLPRIKDRIYAIGGSFKGEWEYFDANAQVWIEVTGYDKLLSENDIQTFTIVNSYNYY